MRRTITALAVAVVLMAGSIGAQQKRQQEIDLQAAIRTETVDGDLNRAIKQYHDVADKYAGDRAIVADALVHMAECFQKLGDAEATTIYEQVVREYADQKEAVGIARVRLNAGGSVAVATKGDRAVWTGRDVDLFGSISPDGRLLTYVDWGGNDNVMLHDLVAGTNRPLTNNTRIGEFGFGGWSVISRDGQQLVYEWTRNDNVDELHVANLRGSGVPPARTIKAFEPGETIRPFDWSPDGQWLAVLVERIDRSSQIGLLSIPDGAVRWLKSIDWRGVGKMTFSPDGRFVAYSMTVPEARDRTAIYVMAIDASRETAIVDDASKKHVMGWSADGRLVFASDRTGSPSLWTMRVEEGRAKEPPVLVKEHLGSTWSLGLAASGTLYVWQPASATFVRIASFDPDSGRLLDSAGGGFQRFIESRGRPAWSADGKHLLFVSCGVEGGGPCALFDRSSDTGVVREIPHTLGYLAFPRFSPDGRAIITSGGDLKGRKGIYLIDANTGATSLIEPNEASSKPTDPDWSADGRAIVYGEMHGSDWALVERQIGAAQRNEILRTSGAIAGSMRLSPDGRFVAFVRPDPQKRTVTVNVMPVSGGAPRELFTASAPSTIRPQWQWTSDSQAVLVAEYRADRGAQLWRIPLTGQPRQLDIDGRQWTNGLFAVRPDGRQIAFVAQAGALGDEVWALENFLSASPAKK